MVRQIRPLLRSVTFCKNYVITREQPPFCNHSISLKKKRKTVKIESKVAKNRQKGTEKERKNKLTLLRNIYVAIETINTSRTCLGNYFVFVPV